MWRPSAAPPPTSTRGFTADNHTFFRAVPLLLKEGGRVSLTLNERALAVADEMAASAPLLRITVHQTAGARVLDCGVKADGGLRAGLGMARICLADLAEVSLVPGEVDGTACPHVQVTTDHPVLACMASQYAGWQVKPEKFFGMGSGPMRAAYGKEELYDHIPGREQPHRGHIRGRRYVRRTVHRRHIRDDKISARRN